MLLWGWQFAPALELACEFLQAQNTSEMNQLRRFLADTIDLQAEFLVARLDASLPKMLAEAAPADRTNVQKHLNA